MQTAEIAIAPIEGYAAIYGEADLNGDIVAPGALSAAVANPTRVKLLYQHAAEIPAGRWLRFEERAKGLYAYGELIIASEAQRERHALLRAGAFDGLSIGFRTVKARKIPGGRRIAKADLWEVSLVTFPMAPRARLTRIGAARPVAEISPRHVPERVDDGFLPPALPPIDPPGPMKDASASDLARVLRSAAHFVSVSA
ncbi:MAG: HK97 family phage prohead protease [Pseudomonadota bacterium]